MGFRFRKSFGFGPVRVTLSKSGISTSVGVKGARITKGPRGTHATVGAGGLSYTTRVNEPSADGAARGARTSSREIPPVQYQPSVIGRVLLVGAILLVAFFAFRLVQFAIYMGNQSPSANPEITAASKASPIASTLSTQETVEASIADQSSPAPARQAPPAVEYVGELPDARLSIPRFYLDGRAAIYHATDCSAVDKRTMNRAVEAAAKLNGYTPHSCVQARRAVGR